MTRVGQHVVFSEDTVIGQGVRIGHHVVFHPGVAVGDEAVILDGAVVGRPPLATATNTRPIDDAFRPVSIGSGCIIGANAVLYAGVTLGQRVMVGDLASVREGCLIGDESIVGRGVLVMYDTRVGARTRVIDGAILTGQMVVEDDVFIGPGVNSINDNDVYLKRFGLRPFNVSGPTVRRFALIGAGANLAAGVDIGMGAIVAPSAMVTADVPAWTVVAGVPARALRSVAADEREQIARHFGLDVEAQGAGS